MKENQMKEILQKKGHNPLPERDTHYRCSNCQLTFFKPAIHEGVICGCGEATPEFLEPHIAFMEAMFLAEEVIEKMKCREDEFEIISVDKEKLFVTCRIGYRELGCEFTEDGEGRLLVARDKKSGEILYQDH
jgi:hypothetical protein